MTYLETLGGEGPDVPAPEPEPSDPEPQSEPVANDPLAEVREATAFLTARRSKCRCGDPNCSTPRGLCHCGCGSTTPLYSSSDERTGRVAGEPMLVLNGHYKKADKSLAIPFYTDKTKSVRVMSKTLDEIAKPSHRKLLVKYMRQAVTLYEALSETVDKNGRTGTASLVAINDTGRARMFGKGLTSHSARYAWNFLVEMGAAKPHGPGYKDLIKHPKECRPDLWEALLATGFSPDAPVRRRSQPVQQPEEPIEATVVPEADASVDNTEPEVSLDNLVRNVPDDALAEAIAKSMWTRYDWMLSEVGRLTEALAQAEAKSQAQEAEIGRLRALVEPPVTTADIALRVLA